MSTQEVAEALGRSPRWVTTARNSYIRHAGIEQKKTQTIRNHAHMSLVEEREFLVPFFEKARSGRILVANGIHSHGVSLWKGRLWPLSHDDCGEAILDEAGSQQQICSEMS